MKRDSLDRSLKRATREYVAFGLAVSQPEESIWWGSNARDVRRKDACRGVLKTYCKGMCVAFGWAEEHLGTIGSSIPRFRMCGAVRVELHVQRTCRICRKSFDLGSVNHDGAATMPSEHSHSQLGSGTGT